VRSALTGFLRDRGGVTAIEYGLLCALTTLAVLGAIYTLGNQTLTQLFEVVASSM
jgi:Flp pilus assembly pilin Flp